MRLSVRVGIACWACGPLLACGSPASPTSPSSKSHAPLPTIAYQGGPVLAAPQVVTVTFAGDELAGPVQIFGRDVAASAWWDAVRSPYCAKATACVGDGPPGTSVEIEAPPATTYTDADDKDQSTLQTWLAQAIAGGALPGPAPGVLSDTLYVLYFPATTTITYDGLSSCAEGGFDGYHSYTDIGRQVVPYAVVVECPPEPPPFAAIAPVTLLQNTTITASHEILESATDPAAVPAYELDETDTSNWAWLDIEGGGEAADMCVDPFGMNQDQAGDGLFVTQRIWSNRQASQSVDPCAPVPGATPYFNVAPTKSLLVVGVGQSATFEADAFTDDPGLSWTLSAQDWTDSTDPYLRLTISGATQTRDGPQIQVRGGAAIQVTVTLVADPGGLDTGEADGSLVSVTGDIQSPTAAHWWPFAVLSPADAARQGVDPSGGDRPPLHARFHRIPRPGALPSRRPRARAAF